MRLTIFCFKRYTVEKPTRHVSSTLIKKEMTLTDRGTYECKDATEENSFGLYITVIYSKLSVGLCTGFSSWCSDLINVLTAKGIGHPQKIFFKYVMLRRVTKNSMIIITKYTWYHRCRVFSKLLEGRHYGCTGSQIRRREGENWNALDVTWALSRLTQIIVSPER